MIQIHDDNYCDMIADNHDVIRSDFGLCRHYIYINFGVKRDETTIVFDQSYR